MVATKAVGSDFLATPYFGTNPIQPLAPTRKTRPYGKIDFFVGTKSPTQKLSGPEIFKIYVAIVLATERDDASFVQHRYDVASTKIVSDALHSLTDLKFHFSLQKKIGEN